MRIAKGTDQLLTDAPSERFLLVVDAMEKEIVIEKEHKELLSLRLDGDGNVRASVSFPDGKCFSLTAPGAYHKQVILTSGYARVGLYVEGVLYDEDFFFTPLDYRGAVVHAGSYMHFEAGYEYHSAPECTVIPGRFPAGKELAPAGYGLAVAGVMTALFADRLHLFYWDSRRAGAAKDGKGAHRLCAVYTENGEDFGTAPMTLGMDNVNENTIADAAVIEVGGRGYLYYLVDYAGGRALSCAVSEDGFSYMKTGLDVELPQSRPADMTALTVFFHNGIPTLGYITAGEVWFADSIDLLHFAAPRKIAAPVLSALRAIPGTDGEYFLGLSGERVLLLRFADDTLTPVADLCPASPAPADKTLPAAARLPAAAIYGERAHLFTVTASGTVAQKTIPVRDFLRGDIGERE